MVKQCAHYIIRFVTFYDFAMVVFYDLIHENSSIDNNDYFELLVDGKGDTP